MAVGIQLYEPLLQ